MSSVPDSPLSRIKGTIVSMSGIEEESSLGKAYDRKLIARLLPFLRPHRLLAVGSVMLVLVLVAVEVLKPHLVQLAIDGPVKLLAENAEDAGAWTHLHWLTGIFIGLLVAEYVLRYFGDFSMMSLGQRVIFDLRSTLYRHLQRLPLKFYDRNPVGRLVTRTSGDIEAIGELFASGLVRMASDVLKLVAILVIMLVMNWRLALTVVLLFPVMVALTSWFRVQARNAFRDMRVKVASLNAFLNEALGGLTVTRIFHQEARQEAKYRKLNEEYRDAAFETVKNFSFFFPVVGLVSTGAIALLLWYGAGLVMENPGEAGAFVAFFLYTEMLFRPIREISERWAILQSAMASTERVVKLLDERNDLRDPDNPAPFSLENFRGEIEFRNVWFAYKGEDWVLRDVSFKIAPGEALALVGSTGSGKTTIINLICRFYDVQKGSVLLDGRDVREYRLTDLRDTLGLVLQDVFLFAGSVLENLRLGNETIARERVAESARLVRASEFIERLPAGLDAPVAERGATFSTGQKQLIAFARALAYDPRILILDEATANIDSETEALLQDALATLMRGRTTVAVAHRLSTIREASQILVLERGQIVERGTHSELLALEGRYWRLYTLQFTRPTESGRRVRVGS